MKESSNEKTESEAESKAEYENADGRKREDGGSKSEGGDLNSEAGETEGGEKNKIEQTESEESLDENKSELGELTMVLFFTLTSFRSLSLGFSRHGKCYQRMWIDN